MSIYDIPVTSIKGIQGSMADFKGKVLIIANTASKCGFTPQYSDLQKLYETYREQGLEILGFPSNQFNEQEPGSHTEVEAFCQMNYGVTFPLFEKTDVRGEDAHPLFQYLTAQAPFQGFDQANPSGKMLQAFLQEKFPEQLAGDSVKWNFTKFIVDRAGNVVARFEPTVDPAAMESTIQSLL